MIRDLALVGQKCEVNPSREGTCSSFLFLPPWFPNADVVTSLEQPFGLEQKTHVEGIRAWVPDNFTKLLNPGLSLIALLSSRERNFCPAQVNAIWDSFATGSWT